MTIDGNDAAGPNWQTLEEIYQHYLTHTLFADGQSAAELIRNCAEAKRSTCSGHQIAMALPRAKPRSDFILQQDLKSYDEQIEKIHADIRRLMIEEASAGNWIAMGRRGPDAALEIAPPRYWHFLTMDIENNAVTGDGISFRDLRCRITKDIPKDDPLHEALRAVQQHPATDRQSNFVGTPKAPPAPEQLARNDAPGRPSFFHLVEAEFARRRESNSLESSLNKEAQALATWYRIAHPNLQPYRPKTIANRLRAQYRAAMSPPP